MPAPWPGEEVPCAGGIQGREGAPPLVNNIMYIYLYIVQTTGGAKKRRPSTKKNTLIILCLFSVSVGVVGERCFLLCGVFSCFYFPFVWLVYFFFCLLVSVDSCRWDGEYFSVLVSGTYVYSHNIHRRGGTGARYLASLSAPCLQVRRTLSSQDNGYLYCYYYSF